VGSVQTPAAASKLAGGCGGSVATRSTGTAGDGLAVVLDVDLNSAVLRRHVTGPLDLELADVVTGPAYMALRERALTASVHGQLERPAGLDELPAAAADHGALRQRTAR
jgi:hypothetical protein